jgi:hypothetical protein
MSPQLVHYVPILTTPAHDAIPSGDLQTLSPASGTSTCSGGASASSRMGLGPDRGVDCRPWVAGAASPVDCTRVEPQPLTGRIFGWPWVRAFSPFVNLYAVIFLIGGAVLSAIRFSRDPLTRHRVWANVLIALGAILPGIGGAAIRAGYTEVLYVMELAGLLLMWAGFRMSVATPSPALQPVRA